MSVSLWPAPGLDDTQLSKSGLPLELHRAQITDRRVSTFRVVEALDIVKHICLCLIARPVRFVTGALGLQRREEALHRGVVPHIAGSAHRTNDAAVGHQPLELLARVLAAAIGVMQQCIGLSATPIAITSASVTSCAVMAALIDQPTTRGEKRSMTGAT